MFEDLFEVGFVLLLEEVAEVEGGADVGAIDFLDDAEGIGVVGDVEADVRIEDDFQAGRVGHLGDFSEDGDRSIVQFLRGRSGAVEVYPKGGAVGFEELDCFGQAGVVGCFGGEVYFEVGAEHLQPVGVEGFEHGGDVVDAGVSDSVVSEICEELGLLLGFHADVTSDAVVEGEERVGLWFCGGDVAGHSENSEESQAGEGRCVLMVGSVHGGGAFEL